MNLIMQIILVCNGIISVNQLDSFSGHNISSDRLKKATGWTGNEMKHKWVLDIGCGSGRFSEVALKAGAKVVAIDYSSAVDACYENLIGHDNIYIVQANIYELPFIKGSFDFVYALGVLQHTPDVSKAFLSLPPMLKSGGKLCVDYYEKKWAINILPKYWLRPITKHIPKPILFKLLKTGGTITFHKSNTWYDTYCRALFKKISTRCKLLQHTSVK